MRSRSPSPTTNSGTDPRARPRVALDSIYLVTAGTVLTFMNACTPSTASWASPVPRGEGRFGVTAGAKGITDGTLPADIVGISPTLQLDYRRGLSKNVDLGGDAGPTSVAIGARFALAKTAPVELSIGTHVRARFGKPLNWFPAADPYAIALEPEARIGLNASTVGQLGFFVKPALVYMRDASFQAATVAGTKSGVSLWPEAGLAFDWRLGKQLHLVTTLSLTTFIGSDSFYLSDDTLRINGSAGLFF